MPQGGKGVIVCVRKAQKAHVGGGRDETGKRQDRRTTRVRPGSKKRKRKLGPRTILRMIISEIPQCSQMLRQDITDSILYNRPFPHTAYRFLIDPKTRLRLWEVNPEWEAVRTFIDNLGRGQRIEQRASAQEAKAESKDGLVTA